MRGCLVTLIALMAAFLLAYMGFDAFGDQTSFWICLAIGLFLGILYLKK